MLLAGPVLLAGDVRLAALARPVALLVALLAALLVALFAVPLATADFAPVDFLDAVGVARTVLVVDLAAAVLLAVPFAAAVFAGALFAVLDRAADVLAGDVLAGEVAADLAVDLAAADFLVAVAEEDFVAGDRPLVAFAPVPDVDFAVAAATLGSFFAPLTTSLNPVPARNAGTAVAFTFTAAPVAGLRAVRALRARFSNTPKPVMATRSPRATERTMMSTTWSTAC